MDVSDQEQNYGLLRDVHAMLLKVPALRKVAVLAGSNLSQDAFPSTCDHQSSYSNEQQRRCRSTGAAPGVAELEALRPSNNTFDLPRLPNMYVISVPFHH